MNYSRKKKTASNTVYENRRQDIQQHLVLDDLCASWCCAFQVGHTESHGLVRSNCMCVPSHCEDYTRKMKVMENHDVMEMRGWRHREALGGEYTSTHPWGPPGRCWHPTFRVQDGQRARLRALEAEACARCTAPGHFSLLCSLWFWNKPSFRGTPWAPSGKVNSPGGTDTGYYDQP